MPAAVLAVSALMNGLQRRRERLMNWLARRREARMTRIETELDRTQEELRATVLTLAQALGAEAHEARKALIRESYRASGKLP